MVSWKHQVEYAVYRVLVLGLRRIPESMALKAGECLALFAQNVLGWRRSAARARILEVFPDRPCREREEIRCQALRGLGRNAVELLRPVGTEIEGREAALAALEAARESGRGVLLVIVHSGNWDLAGRHVTAMGVPMCFIARHQKNERLYQELVSAREVSGGTVVDRDDPRLFQKLLRFLGGNGVVAILVDVRSRTPDEPFCFLGRPAPLANGLGLLAARSRAEVLPVFTGRDGQGRHVWKAFPARRLEPGHSPEVRRELLQSCLDDLGGEILRCPGSYFWFNKRWMLEPHKGEGV